MTLSQTLSNFLFQGFPCGLADAIHDFGIVLLAKQAEIELLVFHFHFSNRAGVCFTSSPLGRSSLGYASPGRENSSAGIFMDCPAQSFLAMTGLDRTRRAWQCITPPRPALRRTAKPGRENSSAGTFMDCPAQSFLAANDRATTGKAPTSTASPGPAEPGLAMTSHASEIQKVWVLF